MASNTTSRLDSKVKALAISKATAKVQAEYQAKRLDWAQAHVLAQVIAYCADSEDFQATLVAVLQGE
jgi:hypothetical protein